MGTATRLRECPFCGGEPDVKNARVAEDCMEAWIECGRCYARTDAVEGSYSEFEAAVRLWNRRTATNEPGEGGG